MNHIEKKLSYNKNRFAGNWVSTAEQMNFLPEVNR